MADKEQSQKGQRGEPEEGGREKGRGGGSRAGSRGRRASALDVGCAAPVSRLQWGYNIQGYNWVVSQGNEAISHFSHPEHAEVQGCTSGISRLFSLRAASTQCRGLENECIILTRRTGAEEFD